ncbi:MAG: D-alanine--poly(phosphoribitol) ligase subunit 2 [Chloroflexota bacterium]|nr:D-alanine--poly(phosphoribitol) ligase subunit 2 [Chloroflexota bacterium]MDE3103244.1 D-alanine--poly(phosphoribitol) ligase subunit 2 [Chloroflexota bacterium]
MSLDVRASIFRILGDVTGLSGLEAEPDLDLLEAGLLDSLGLVSLILAFDDELGLSIAPSDLDKKAWATPRSLVADVERRARAVAR